MVIRSMTPLKLSPSPMGSWSAMGLALSVFSTSSSARRKEARSLSSLLTQASSGSARSAAISQCASVWCLTPETAETSSSPPSQTAIERSASVSKSEKPGASSRLRRAVLCFIAVSLAGFSVLAQVVPQGSATAVTRGAEAPGQSFALQDDGTSLGGNPAGLGFVSGLEADFLHNGYYGDRPNKANALYLAGGPGPLALGLGFDWVDRVEACFTCPVLSPPVSYRRTSFGGALRLGQLSLGVVHRGFTSGVELSSWDFGAIARPLRWLSLGATVADANRPGTLPRRWIVSAGVRPLAEKLDLAADLRWSECTNAVTGTPCGLDHEDWTITALGRFLPGRTAIGQLGILDGSHTVALLGLQVDLGHVGAAYAPTFG